MSGSPMTRYPEGEGTEWLGIRMARHPMARNPMARGPMRKIHWRKDPLVEDPLDSLEEDFPGRYRLKDPLVAKGRLDSTAVESRFLERLTRDLW